VSDPSPVEVPEASASFDEHRQGVIGAVVQRFVEEMYFRNILAIMVVGTLCGKEIMGHEVGSEFYMLGGLVLGMYFTAPPKTG
jgi:hypothetical protein